MVNKCLAEPVLTCTALVPFLLLMFTVVVFTIFRAYCGP